MPKTAVSQWDTTAANNTDINSISLAEGVMQPPAVNDAFREMMSQVKAAGFISTPAYVTLTDPNADRLMFWDDSAGTVAWLTPSAALEISTTSIRVLETIGISVVSESTTLTTGTAKRTFRMPFAFTVTGVRASLSTASSSGIPTVDINEGGTTILSTKLTIDANELTSTTAATAAVVSDTAWADDAEITIDIDVAGTGAQGLKVYINGYRP
jgi:hypothetical protein